MLFRSFIQSEQVNRNSIKQFTHLHVEMLFYKDENYQARKPLVADVSLQLPEWNVSNHIFKGINGFARIQQLIEFAEEKLSLEKLMQSFNQREVKEHVKKNQQTKLFDVEMEVDLHWSEIADEFDFVPVNEILDAQLNKFHQAMHLAVKRKAKSLIIIHGVGEGKLKNAIRNELMHFKGIRFNPANEIKYGLGATRIIFE